MKPGWLACGLLLVLARTAGATGLCEDTGPRYDAPELFDPVTQSFAIPASQPWCDQVPDGEGIAEQRGAVAFVELRDIHDRVLGTLATATGADADHLRHMRGDFEAIPLGKLHATLLARGYAPLAPLTACALVATWTDVAPPGGWRAAQLQLDVMRAGKRLLRAPLGAGAIARRGDQTLRAHALPQARAIAVFAVVPSCAGPPPGYFGPDDGGLCYHVDEPHVRLLDAKAAPALAACLP